jgi:hypothetical protein
MPIFWHVYPNFLTLVYLSCQYCPNHGEGKNMANCFLGSNIYMAGWIRAEPLTYPRTQFPSSNPICWRVKVRCTTIVSTYIITINTLTNKPRIQIKPRRRENWQIINKKTRTTKSELNMKIHPNMCRWLLNIVVKEGYVVILVWTTICTSLGFPRVNSPTHVCIVQISKGYTRVLDNYKWTYN